MEEERRLCYVGMTRAQRRLYMLRAFHRGFRGSFEPSVQSRFLADIPQKLIVAQGSGAKVRNLPGKPDRVGRQSNPRTVVVTRPKERIERGPSRRRVDATNGGPRTARPERRVAPVSAGADDLRTGDKVKHEKFGEGVVVAVKATPSDIEVTVAFKDGGGIKRLLMSFAPLEKVV
jgi:DNA helicase-2/ATP-dependent DNA helicase PcrA